MKRDEFESVLKRALELQSFRANPAETPLSEDELAHAAERLGISQEILQQALREVRRSRKQFRIRGKPEEVREAFLRNFLLQDTIVPQAHRLPLVRVDRQALQIGKSTSVRVFHPQFTEIDAEVAFTADGPDHTLVSYSGNTRLGQKSYLYAAIAPLIVLISSVGPLIAAGAPVAFICSMLSLPVLILFLAIWSFKKQAARVDVVLREYFENIQILGDLMEKREAQNELTELRLLRDKLPPSSGFEPLPEDNGYGDQPETPPKPPPQRES